MGGITGFYVGARRAMAVIALLVFFGSTATTWALPTDFVYLNQAVPSIQQDMRYASNYNFVGHVIPGYQAPQCIVTQGTAKALAQVQTALAKQGLGLKVYDCYRPTEAVNAFFRWSQTPGMDSMKVAFYPDLAKSQLFKLGYIANYSGHSRGSTVDITLVPLGSTIPQHPSHSHLTACNAPLSVRAPDNSLDMGTGFDCLDPSAHVFYPKAGTVQYQHRMQLRQAMLAAGFTPYADEWWHFTLKNEPFPQQYFNFPVSAPK
jgi:D-alanyl-D-alanine dipeptidase